MDDLIARDDALAAITTDGGCGICTQRILDVPEMDAIPVEWLKKWPKDLRMGAVIRDIIQDWRKGQEART